MKVLAGIALVVVIGVTFGKLWSVMGNAEVPPAVAEPPKRLPPPTDPALRRAHIAHEVQEKLEEGRRVAVARAVDTSLLIRLGSMDGAGCKGLLERVRDGEFWGSTEAAGFHDVLRQAGFTKLACDDGGSLFTLPL